MNHKLANGMKMGKGNKNTITFVFSLKGLKILYQDRREQVDTIVMDQFKSILFNKPGPANKQHIYQSIIRDAVLSALSWMPRPSSWLSCFCWLDADQHKSYYKGEIQCSCQWRTFFIYHWSCRLRGHVVIWNNILMRRPRQTRVCVKHESLTRFSLEWNIILMNAVSDTILSNRMI